MFFKKKKKLQEFKVTEGIESCWNYHISTLEKPHQSLCGKEVMWTGIPLKNWGKKVPHIPENFCDECKKIYDHLMEKENEKNKR